MSNLFGHPIGVCDECGSNGLELYEFKGRDVCDACRRWLIDWSNTRQQKVELRDLRKLINKANKNYNS